MTRRRRHWPLPRSTCPNCGRELVAGEHRAGTLALMTSVLPWSRADAEDNGLVVQPGQHTVMVESSAFWVTVLPEQPEWTFA